MFMKLSQLSTIYRHKGNLSDYLQEKFFGGYPSINTMFRMHNALLGIDETDVEKPRNPPWVQCCVKSYATDDTDLWKFRTYGIFDTTIEGCIC